MNRMKKKLLSLILMVCLVAGFVPTTALATGIENANTFTVTYKTNADVEMGTITYEVGDKNALPVSGDLGSDFKEFIQRALQKGKVYVNVNSPLWYEDKEFTKPATFPDGQKGENYTLYCNLTVDSISAGSVSNYAENKSYADVGGTIQPFLGATSYYIAGRNDGYDATKAIFEKKNADGQWVEVPEEYYTDKSGTTWPNMIYFSSVADSGTYRLKDVRYTATDNNGEVLYYVDAANTPKDEYTVKIAPVELTITGVTARDRNCDGTDAVELTDGALQGVLYNDDVSFTLGGGKLADKTPGSGKKVTTNITLTGADAGNYTLKQPEDVTVTISDDWGGGPVWSWSDDGKTATVTFTCKGDNTHTQSPDVTITSTVKTPAACTEAGTTIYTAETIFDGQKYTSTKDVADIAKLGHTLKKTDKVDATHTTDGKEAYYTCETCGKHFSDKEGKNEITKLEEYGVIPATGTTESTKPPKPADSGKENPNTKTTGPQTGDNSNFALWISLLFISGGAVTTAVFYSRKRRKTER